MSLDYMNPDSNLKAIGCFIFGGSASIGVMESGFHLDRVLEMTDTMLEENAYHFHKNFEKIPIILPSEWQNNGYLNELKKEDYDILISNCPCSSLSQLNRNASLDGEKNAEFYRVFNAIRTLQPKSFFIENAHTLIKLGYPILKDMINLLKNEYKFSIIRDYAGAHDVPMKRMRTLVVGWRKDMFDGQIPLLHMNLKKATTAKDVIGDLYEYELNNENIHNHILIEDKIWSPTEKYFNYVKPDRSCLLSFIDNWNILREEFKGLECNNEIVKAKQKIEAEKRIWDKTPWRVGENSICPSMTSVTRIIHPIHNRTFTIREYARLMGYPDDFVFYPECKTPIITAIAQGVPKNFVKYITSEIKEALLKNRELVKDSEDKMVVFQHHTHHVYKSFTLDEINNLEKLDHEKKSDGYTSLTK